MTLQEKLEWAKRAFEEIAKDCEGIAELCVVSQLAAQTLIRLAAEARDNIRILEQP